MGEIERLAEELRKVSLEGNRPGYTAELLYTIFTLIESEFQKLAETIGKKLREQDGQTELNLINMDTLNTQIKHLEDKFDSILKQHLKHLEIKDDVPTDKDKSFRVGDTVALKVHGDLRIVLEVKQDYLRLMNVPSGYIQENCISSRYTFVYRPRFPDRKER